MTKTGSNVHNYSCHTLTTAYFCKSQKVVQTSIVLKGDLRQTTFCRVQTIIKLISYQVGINQSCHKGPVVQSPRLVLIVG